MEKFPKESKVFDPPKPNDYDSRSGEFVRRGDDYGVGKRQPVGSESQREKPKEKK